MVEKRRITLAEKNFSLQPRLVFRATPTIQNLFEILIFLSLDSNDVGAFYCLKADTVFRQCMSRWPRKTICKSICIGLFDIGNRFQRVTNRDRAHCVSALSEPWSMNRGRMQVNT